MTSPSGDGLSLGADIELVRAAILYADELELVSPGASMLASVAHLADTGSDGITELLCSLDDDTVSAIAGGQQLPAGWREVVRLMRTPFAEPILHSLGGQSFFRDYNENLDSSARQLADITENMLRDAGVNDLLPVIEAGILSLSPDGFNGASTDEAVSRWVDKIEKLLQDDSTRLLFDDRVGSLVRAMIHEGKVQPAQLALKHSREVTVGSGLIARLPAFPQAPTDELLDLKADMAAPLNRYRSAVLSLAESLGFESFDAGVRDAISDIFRAQVEPALMDLEEGFAQHGLIKELARSAFTNVNAILSSAGIYLAVDKIADVHGLVSYMSGVAPLTAQIIGDAVTERGSSLRELRRHELFYLYETNRRLVKSGRSNASLAS